MEFSHSTGEHCVLAEVHRLLAALAMASDRGAIDSAETEPWTAIDTARNQGAKFYELRATADLARLWGDTGRRDDARGLLQPVYDSFTEGFDSFDLREAKVLLDELT